jgi:hypothetical protein
MLVTDLTPLAYMELNVKRNGAPTPSPAPGRNLNSRGKRISNRYQRLIPLV